MLALEDDSAVSATQSSTGYLNRTVLEQRVLGANKAKRW